MLDNFHRHHLGSRPPGLNNGLPGRYTLADELAVWLPRAVPSGYTDGAGDAPPGQVASVTHI